MVPRATLLKESVQKYFKKRKIDPDFVDVLEIGYCPLGDILQTFEKWCHDVYPHLKPIATPSEKSWLKQCRSRNSKSNINFSQAHIDAQLSKFLKKYPQADNDKLIRDLEDGHCVGYSFFIGTSILIMNAAQSKTTKPIDSFNKIYAVMKSISGWDGKSELCKKDQKNFLSFLRHIYRAQHHRKEHSIPYTDWDKLYHDTKGRELKKTYSDTLLFTVKNIKKFVDEVIIQDTQHSSSKHKTSTELYYIGAQGHASVIITHHNKVNGKITYQYFDSNNINGIINVPNPKILATLIDLAHKDDDPTHDITFNRFSFENYRAPRLSASIMNPSLISQLSNKDKSDLLFGTIETGNFKLFEHIVKLNADVSLKNACEMTLLHSAAFFGHIQIARYIVHNLLKEIDIHAVTDVSGRNALHMTASSNYFKIAKLLLDYKIDVDSKLKNTAPKLAGYTSLAIAAHYGHLETATILIEHKANLELTTLEDEKTPLHLAVGGTHYDVVDLLIRNNANLFAKTKNRLTPFDLAKTDAMRKQLAPPMLKQAIQNGDIFSINKCLPYIIDINVSLENGSNLLVIAAQSGHVLAVEELLANEADINSVDNNGNTALIAAAKDENEFMVKFLLNQGAKIEPVEIESLLTTVKNTEIIKILENEKNVRNQLKIAFSTSQQTLFSTGSSGIEESGWTVVQRRRRKSKNHAIKDSDPKVKFSIRRNLDSCSIM